MTTCHPSPKPPTAFVKISPKQPVQPDLIQFHLMNFPFQPRSVAPPRAVHGKDAPRGQTRTFYCLPGLHPPSGDSKAPCEPECSAHSPEDQDKVSL